jgi:hypothetical protein
MLFYYLAISSHDAATLSAGQLQQLQELRLLVAKVNLLKKRRERLVGELGR